MVQHTNMLAADPLSIVCCKEGPPAHQKDPRLESDLGKSEAKSTPQTHCCAPQSILEPFLFSDIAYCSDEKGHSNSRNTVSMKGCCWPATMVL